MGPRWLTSMHGDSAQARTAGGRHSLAAEPMACPAGCQSSRRIGGAGPDLDQVKSGLFGRQAPIALTAADEVRISP